jgi:hypothetical protein
LAARFLDDIARASASVGWRLVIGHGAGIAAGCGPGECVVFSDCPIKTMHVEPAE